MTQIHTPTAHKRARSSSQLFFFASSFPPFFPLLEQHTATTAHSRVEENIKLHCCCAGCCFCCCCADQQSPLELHDSNTREKVSPKTLFCAREATTKTTKRRVKCCSEQRVREAKWKTIEQEEVTSGIQFFLSFYSMPTTLAWTGICFALFFSSISFRLWCV